MSKKLLLSVALTSALMSGHAFAHDSSFQNNSCDMELDGHIQYYQGDLTVQMDNGLVMTIDSHHNMTIDGESVSLDSEQQRWVSEYYNNIDIAIPMTLNIASEGLQIANVAVTEVFTELLGGDQMGDDFRELFDSLETKLNTSFYDDAGNIRVDSTKFDEPGWFDESWEQEFEAQIESLISESMGRILIAVGTQMLWEGGDMSEFEQKMERWGEDLEYRLESQAAALEEKGDALCKVLKKADYAEGKMQASISGLDDLNLLDIDQDNHHDHNDEMKM
ncbi:MAG TPA: hypothetical protein DIV42_07350 [Alteromonas macleodii]|nr:DUF2884 family protein [Alteromonas macleodii]MAL72943.1 hypothetical protein [Alteromonas sp.]HCS80964.1 hypothetical protein [Alteromonas macleodii]HCY28498.1 hypothetical protein [Alteromonas macleodii]|tara:strand:- start:110 stop:940 length:831 start_codon:yes stop_codon:yes gene_type:complete